MYTTMVSSFKNLLSRGRAITEEASLLEIAFLCSNVSLLLSEYIIKETLFSDPEENMISDLIDFLERMDEALHFMYEGQMHLIPNSEVLETVFNLTEGEFRLPYDKVRASVDASKKVLSSLIEQSESPINVKSIETTKVFIKQIQTIVLQKLDYSLVDYKNDINI